MATKMKKDTTLLDEAESLVKNIDLCDLIDDEFDEKEKITPEELEKARKRYLKEQYLKKLDDAERELSKFSHKDYDVSDIKNDLVIRNFFSTFGKDIYMIMEPETYDNGTRLIRDERLIRQIKDKKFQKYVTIRKSLHAFKKKLEKTDSPNKDYLNTEIMTITKRLDAYISSYLLVLLVLSNTEQMTDYVCCKLKQKKEHNIK